MNFSISVSDLQTLKIANKHMHQTKYEVFNFLSVIMLYSLQQREFSKELVF